MNWEEKISQLLQERTQSEVANYLGVTQSAVQKWSTGMATPRKYYQEGLFELLGMDCTVIIIQEERKHKALKKGIVKCGRKFKVFADGKYYGIYKSLNEAETVLRGVKNDNA